MYCAKHDPMRMEVEFNTCLRDRLLSHTSAVYRVLVQILTNSCANVFHVSTSVSLDFINEMRDLYNWSLQYLFEWWARSYTFSQAEMDGINLKLFNSYVLIIWNPFNPLFILTGLFNTSQNSRIEWNKFTQWSQLKGYKNWYYLKGFEI